MSSLPVRGNIRHPSLSSQARMPKGSNPKARQGKLPLARSEPHKLRADAGSEVPFAGSPKLRTEVPTVPEAISASFNKPTERSGSPSRTRPDLEASGFGTSTLRLTPAETIPIESYTTSFVPANVSKSLMTEKIWMWFSMTAATAQFSEDAGHFRPHRGIIRVA